MPALLIASMHLYNDTRNTLKRNTEKLITTGTNCNCNIKPYEMQQKLKNKREKKTIGKKQQQATNWRDWAKKKKHTGMAKHGENH